MEFPQWLFRERNEQEEEEDYYKVLACTPDARFEDIQKQYHKLALQYHPDKIHTHEVDNLSGSSFLYLSTILVFLIMLNGVLNECAGIFHVDVNNNVHAL